MSFDPTSIKNRDAILDALRLYHDETRLACHGGYPSDIDAETIDSHVVVASVDHDDAPQLSIYTWDDLERWYGVALRYREKEDCDIVEALMETEGELY